LASLSPLCICLCFKPFSLQLFYNIQTGQNW
jgi:hypothetical protein